MSKKNVPKAMKSVEGSICVVKNLFRRKYKDAEPVKIAVKRPTFWGAVLGECIGTMLLTIAFMTTIGVFRADYVPIFMFGAIMTIYAAIYSISGAHLNPLITVGAMVTRRMSIARGVFYMLAQFAGAWAGLAIITLFKNWGDSGLEVPPSLIYVNGESFWAVALIQLMGAIILGFMFVRIAQSQKKSALMYASVMTCAVVVLYLLGVVFSQNYFGFYSSLVFNPASASAYSIYANLTDGFGQVVLISLAYLVIPMVGGVVGCYLADLIKALVGAEYSYTEEDA